MKTAKYFYHYTLWKPIENRMEIVGQGSGVTDVDLTIMEDAFGNCNYTFLRDKLIKDNIKNMQPDWYIDIDRISKL